MDGCFGIRRFLNRHVRQTSAPLLPRSVFMRSLAQRSIKEGKIERTTVQVNTNILRNSRSFRAEKGIVLGEN